MPRALPTVAAAALALTISTLQPAGALAAAPDISDRHVERSGLLTHCDGYDVNFLASIDLRYIVTVDAAGEPVREIRHVAFTGTLSGPGGELPYAGHFTRTTDFATQRVVFTGLRFTVPVSGGARMLAAGTDAFSLDPDMELEKTGRVPAEFYADVCAALAP